VKSRQTRVTRPQAVRKCLNNTAENTEDLEITQRWAGLGYIRRYGMYCHGKHGLEEDMTDNMKGMGDGEVVKKEE
jgi:hypothetical protein